MLEEHIDLGKPTASDIARMVHEVVTEDPGGFNNLEDDEELFRQVSKALVSITESDDFRINIVSEFRFIPCRVQGEVRVRRVNHVNDKVWGVDVNRRLEELLPKGSSSSLTRPAMRTPGTP